jgi:photosystem II stability/assembly factor-like uncharacterized protein
MKLAKNDAFPGGGSMGEQVRLYAATNDGVCIVRSTGGGWEQANLPLPGVISESFAGSVQHPERVYVAGAKAGLYATDDAGGHWSQLFDGGDVRSVALDPTNEDVIYLGTEPVHLFRSEDRGDSWEELTALQDFPEDVKFNWWGPQPPHQGHVADIFIHPDDPSTIYLALEHGGVVRSFDRGASWEDVSKGIDYLDMHVLRALPGSRSRYFVSSAREFFVSDDPTNGWVASRTGFTRDYFHDFVFLAPHQQGGDPAMLMATADKSPGYWDRPEHAQTAFFRSRDCAASWERVGADLPEQIGPWAYALANHPSNPRAAFAGFGDLVRGPQHAATYGQGSIMATYDEGDSWQTLPVDVAATFGLWAAPE